MIAAYRDLEARWVSPGELPVSTPAEQRTAVVAVAGHTMINHETGYLQRRMLLSAFAVLAGSVVVGSNKIMAAIEQNTLKRRGVGLRALNSERASAGFTLFAPHFV